VIDDLKFDESMLGVWMKEGDRLGDAVDHGPCALGNPEGTARPRRVQLTRISAHRPICAGDKLVARAMLGGWEGTENGTRGSLVVETRTEDRELVNEQRGTFFVRGFDAGERVVEVRGSPRADGGQVRSQTGPRCGSTLIPKSRRRQAFPASSCAECAPRPLPRGQC